KLRGFRIEPGEIEAALATHPAVEHCAVVARTDDGETRLVGYVVGAGAPVAELRRHLAALLPDYMMPAAFVPLDALPLNASGKVDRQALAEAEAEASETATRGAAAPTAIEAWLVERRQAAFRTRA
ncbi:MAG: hypothetical protein KC619_30355, partial [Myxococcales bacterium]|nr:hypothetical protein [Myxococcales bacterium]